MKKKIRFSEVFSSFSEIEKKEFSEFISLSFFNKGRNYSEFFKSLKTDENGILRLNGSRKDRTIYNRLSELTILAEKFLIIKSLDKNEFTAEKLLLDELYSRKIRHFYEQRFKALKKRTSLKKTGFDKINELYEINLLQKENDVDTENSKVTIDAYRNNFDLRMIQFFIEILEFMITEQFFKNNVPDFNQSYRTDIFEKQDFGYLLSYFKKNLQEYYPLVSFYYYLYKSVLNLDDTDNYYTAKRLLIKDLKNLSDEVKMVLYQFMIDYNIRKINKEENTANRDLFYFANKICEIGLTNEKIMRGFHNTTFIDYTMNALGLKKFSWAENFIDKFGKLLQGKNSEDAVFLCRAFLEYYRKNFKGCKEYVEKVKKIDPYYYVHATKLSIQSSYELGEFEDCHTLIKRLLEYLRVKKETAKYLIDYTHKFCLSFTLLLKLIENPVQKNYLNLEYDLSHGNIVGRKWIERKMKEIKVVN